MQLGSAYSGSGTFLQGKTVVQNQGTTTGMVFNDRATKSYFFNNGNSTDLGTGTTIGMNFINGKLNIGNTIAEGTDKLTVNGTTYLQGNSRVDGYLSVGAVAPSVFDFISAESSGSCRIKTTTTSPTGHASFYLQNNVGLTKTAELLKISSGATYCGNMTHLYGGVDPIIVSGSQVLIGTALGSNRPTSDNNIIANFTQTGLAIGKGDASASIHSIDIVRTGQASTFTKTTTSTSLALNGVGADGSNNFQARVYGTTHSATYARNKTILTNQGNDFIIANSGNSGGGYPMLWIQGNIEPTDNSDVKMNLKNGKLSIGNLDTEANNSSILELTSTTQGFLPPRMTATQGAAITKVDGLMIYVTDTDATFTSLGFWGVENNVWIKL